ncbi:MAG: hypothetical protein R2873_34505 [Caldilineaceae bacterium]
MNLDPDPGVEFGDYIGFELYIAGEKTDEFFFDATIQSGESGRYRYLWDGRDAQGNLLPPGSYDYAAKFSVPYQAQYCYALNGIFGNPPDCTNGATGRFLNTTDDLWVRVYRHLRRSADSLYGSGWVLAGQQRLYERKRADDDRRRHSS